MREPSSLDTENSKQNIDIVDERVFTEGSGSQNTEDYSSRIANPLTGRNQGYGRQMANNPVSMPSGSSRVDDKLRKKSYGEQLKEQMRINHEKKLMELNFDRELDQYTMRSRIENDPFGRPGAGAPKRDEYGNIIATKPKKVFGYDPRSLINGNEAIPIKPHNDMINNLLSNRNNFEPVPSFSLKAQLARNNLVSQSLNNLQGLNSPSGGNQPSSKPYLSPQGNQFKVPEIQTNNLASSVDLTRFDNRGYNSRGESDNMFRGQYPPYPYPFPMSPQFGPYGYMPPFMPFPGMQNNPFDPMSVRGNMQSINYGGNNNSGGHIFTEPDMPAPQRENRFNNNDRSVRGTIPSPPRDDFNVMPYPAFDDVKSNIDKEKAKQKHIENQRELLQQMEDNKRRKEEEARRKKEEEAREEERLRRDHQELVNQGHSDVHNRRNLKETIKGEEQFRATRFKIIDDHNSTNVSFSPHGHKHGKRVRTPIELYEARKRIEDLEKQKVVVESKVIKELPIDIEKSIHHTIDSELTGVRKEIITHQQDLHDGLLELKKQIHTANKERVDAQREIDDLKYQFKQQQYQEEIRRTELYNAMMKTYMQAPSILPTITKIEMDKEQSENKFEFPQKPPHLKRVGFSKEEKERDILDYLLSNTKMLDMRIQPDKLVQTVDEEPRPDSAHVFSGAESGMKYLSYFNTPDMNMAIKVNDDNRYDIPDDVEEFERKFHSEDPQSIYGIMSKNKKRIDALEEIEAREKLGRFDDLFSSPPSDYYTMKGDDGKEIDTVGDLIEKINNPKRYLYT